MREGGPRSVPPASPGIAGVRTRVGRCVTSLDGKVILVTGATDGLGRALSAELARSGATVLVHGREAGRIADTVAAIGGGQLRTYQADLADLAQVSALADQVLANEP